MLRPLATARTAPRSERKTTPSPHSLRSCITAQMAASRSRPAVHQAALAARSLLHQAARFAPPEWACLSPAHRMAASSSFRAMRDIDASLPAEPRGRPHPRSVQRILVEEWRTRLRGSDDLTVRHCPVEQRRAIALVLASADHGRLSRGHLRRDGSWRPRSLPRRVVAELGRLGAERRVPRRHRPPRRDGAQPRRASRELSLPLPGRRRFRPGRPARRLGRRRKARGVATRRDRAGRSAPAGRDRVDGVGRLTVRADFASRRVPRPQSLRGYHERREDDHWYPICAASKGARCAERSARKPLWHCWLRFTDTAIRSRADALRQLFWLDSGMERDISAHRWPFRFFHTQPRSHGPVPRFAP